MEKNVGFGSKWASGVFCTDFAEKTFPSRKLEQGLEQSQIPVFCVMFSLIQYFGVQCILTVMLITICSYKLKLLFEFRIKVYEFKLQKAPMI